ncbi:MAG: hypothetical protein WKF67_08090 [Rubrobacteraceae bacterium]
MGMRKILARLTDEDLQRVRRIHALAVIAESGRSDMPVEMALAAIEENLKCMAEIRRSYDIREEETFEVDLADGVISERQDA